MRIGLIPLDERPVNTRYPAMIARIAGVELLQPPTPLLSKRRQSADCEALANWLHDAADGLDALIISIETLAYGGLVASRTTDEPAGTIIARLETLRQIKQAYPALLLYGFNVIMRTSRSDDNFEEPIYWNPYGARFYRFSTLLDQQLQGEDVTAELDVLRAELPLEYQHDFLQRRLRNHIVNLTVLEMASRGVFDLLVVSSDDTSPYGLGSREKRWLREQAARILPDDPRLLLYPGADEVGSALLARAVNQLSGAAPAFAIRYSIPGDEDVTAPFEDGPVKVTVQRQVRAVGGAPIDDLDAADFIVAVNTPSRQYPVEWPDPAAIEAGFAHRQAHLQPFTRQIAGWVDAGKQVIVTDVAYPNGADPVLVDLLREHVPLPKLAAYGAWNTAGNTIGVALAQGIAAAKGLNPKAQAQFLVHRFVEDWGYQYAVRRETSDWLHDRGEGDRLIPENIAETTARIETGLKERLALLPGLSEEWRVVPGSVRLPWARLFEVDFDLEKS